MEILRFSRMTYMKLFSYKSFSKSEESPYSLWRRNMAALIGSLNLRVFPKLNCLAWRFSTVWLFLMICQYNDFFGSHFDGSIGFGCNNNNFCSISAILFQTKTTDLVIIFLLVWYSLNYKVLNFQHKEFYSSWWWLIKLIRILNQKQQILW